MGQARYSVISIGGNAEAVTAVNARQFLAEVKGMTPVQVDAVLEGVPTIIQQGIDSETAEALAETMKEIGLKCHVVEQNTATSLRVVGATDVAEQKRAAKANAKKKSAPAYRREDIVDAFHEDVQPLNLSFIEKTQMLLLAACMLVVPVILAMTLLGLMAVALWLNKSGFAIWMGTQPGSPVPYWVAALLLLGFTSVLIYRAIGDWRREKKYVHLDRDRHPQLYIFVEKIAELVGVKAPVSIKVDTEVGVVLKPKEFFRPISGYRSELIIGLPLFYSLNVRQLSGVIAHAFSGFSDDACRYGYPLISAINGWLYRCSSFELNTALPVKSKRRLIAPLGDGFMWPCDFMARLYFRLLLLFSSSLSFALSRRMDMRADLQSAQISGSNEFRYTQFRLRALHYGQMHARSESKKRISAGQGVANYSSYVVEFAEALRIELKPTLINEMEQLVTPLTRSRVVDLGRIVNVEKYQFEGSCFLLGPATELLTDVETLSREVTERYYRTLGVRNKQKLLSVSEDEAGVASRIIDSLNYTFHGWQKSGRYLRFDEFYSYENLSVEAKCQDLRDLASKLSAMEGQLSAMALRYQQIDERANQLHVSKTLQETGVDGNNKQLIDNTKGLRETETHWLKTLNEQGVLRGDLTYYEALISQRISLALSLAKHSQELRDAFTSNDLDEYIDYLKDSASFLYKAYDSVARLRTYTYTLGALVNAGHLENRDKLKAYFSRYENYCHVELESILNVLGAVTYPFALPDGMQDRLEQPSIAEVIRHSVKGIDQRGKSVSLCFKTCHLTLKFLDVFATDLMSELDKIVYETESYYRLR
ncbi:MAG: M48 family metallopeptidase [Pseudomonadales bacterium]|nr:M48 family metallopeptidase [Pseudomonadales bacterium]